MAIAREQYKVGQGGSAASIDITFDTNVTAGSLLICCVNVYNSGTPKTYVVSDNQSNSWSEIYDSTYDGSDSVVLAYAENVNSGPTTITVTRDSASGNTYWTVVIIEVSGITITSPLDQNNANTGSSSSWDSGNITTTQADEYLIGMMAHDTSLAGPETLTEDGAWTLIFEEEDQQNNMPISVAERIVSSTLTESYSGTIVDTVDWLAAIASFKATAVGPTGVLTINDTVIGSIKTINDTAIASVKTINDSAA